MRFEKETEGNRNEEKGEVQKKNPNYKSKEGPTNLWTGFV